jgi:hypothetical protein
MFQRIWYDPVWSKVIAGLIASWWPWRIYQRCRVDPKKAHLQMVEAQAEWFKERAIKLAVFKLRLGQDRRLDKFKLEELVSQLDPHDRQWAMKQTDIDILRRYAGERGAECHDNAGECGRRAEEIANRILW